MPVFLSRQCSIVMKNEYVPGTVAKNAALLLAMIENIVKEKYVSSLYTWRRKIYRG